MDLALNENHDLDLFNGDLFLVSEVDAVTQYLKQRMKLFLGEWFLDEASGIPYFDRILVKNPNLVEIDAIFKNEILSTPGVVELLEFSINIDGQARSMRLAFRARSREGEILFDEELGV
jgi:hypothetical protein